MNEEIKEILEGIKVVIKHNGTLEFDAKELKILLNYITNLQSNWNSLKDCIMGVIDGAREELNMIMQGDDLEYINKCSLQFEAIRKNLEIVLDKMNELEGGNKDEQ